MIEFFTGFRHLPKKEERVVHTRTFWFSLLELDHLAVDKEAKDERAEVMTKKRILVLIHPRSSHPRCNESKSEPQHES
jgi:hypothetical protein